MLTKSLGYQIKPPAATLQGTQFPATFSNQVRCGLWKYVTLICSDKSQCYLHKETTTSFPAHLFTIRGSQKRGPGTLQRRDQNWP